MLKSFKTTKTLTIIIVLLFIVGASIPEIAKSRDFIQMYIFCALITTLTCLFSICTSEERFVKNLNISLILINSIMIIFEILMIVL